MTTARPRPIPTPLCLSRRQALILGGASVATLGLGPRDASAYGIESGDLVEGYNDTVYVQTGRPAGVKGDDLSFTALLEDGFIDVVQGSFVAVAIVSDEMRPGVSMANLDHPGSQANSVCHAVPEPVTGNYRYKLGRGILGRADESPARCPRAFPRTSNCGTWTP